MTHRAAHPMPATGVRFAVLTVSDSRGPGDDPGGDGVAEAALAASHSVARRGHVRDDADAIRTWVEAALRARDVDAIVVTGGTGVAPRDVTPEALAPLFDKRLPGFGEAFRALSFEEVGPPAILSRAEAGVAQGKPVFLVPGSPAGARLAMEKLIAPVASHVRALTGG